MRIPSTSPAKRAEIPRASFRTVDALLEATNRRLAALTEAEARQLWPVIEDALRGVTEKLARTPDATWTAYQAQTYRLQLHRMREGLAKRLNEKLTETTRTMQVSAVSEMRNEVAALSLHFGRPRTLDIDTALVVGDTSKLLVSRLRRASERRANEAISDASRVLAYSTAEGRRAIALARGLSTTTVQGLSFRDTAKLLKERMGVQETNTERLARTELVWAHNLQRFEVADSEGYWLLWNAATYRACDICRALDGKTSRPGPSITDGGTGLPGKSFPGGVMHAPAHPNCRCSCVLWRPEWKE